MASHFAHTVHLCILSLMKQQFVITHTVHQTEIPALLDSWVTNTPSVKIWYSHKKKNAFPYIFVKTERGLLRNCRHFFCLL